MNKNAIIICIFCNEEYIKLLGLLLHSIYLFGELKKTDIIIYTSEKFKEQIIKTTSYKQLETIIYFQTNNYTTISDACKSRLDLFDFEISKNYEKFLYLDTDIIVKLPIETLFDNILTDNMLYALGEGSITEIWWGKKLFGNQIYNYDDKSAFSSGVLLFKNSRKIRELFENIKLSMINNYEAFDTFEQPYFVYNAKRYGLLNNTKLKDYVTTTNYEIYSPYIIIHFSGGVGEHIYKLQFMTKCINELKSLQKPI